MNIIQELLAITESKMKLNEVLKTDGDADEKAVAWLKENFKFDSEYGGNWPATKIWKMMKTTAEEYDDKNYIKIPYVKMKRFNIPDAPFHLDEAFENFNRFIERYAYVYAPDGAVDGLDGIFQVPDIGEESRDMRGTLTFQLGGKNKIKSFHCGKPNDWKYSKISFEGDVTAGYLDAGFLPLLKLHKLEELSFIGEGGGTDVDDEFYDIIEIVNKHLKGGRDIDACKKEMIDKGLEKYAHE